MNYNQAIDKCNPTVINSILGDSSVCQVATQTKSFLKPCKFPMVDCQALSIESANARAKVLAYHLSLKLALFLFKCVFTLIECLVLKVGQSVF